MPRNHDVKYNSVARLGANKLNLLSHATGDCFCNLDGDDHYCDVNFIDDAIFILQNYPDVSIVAFGYRRVIDGVYGNEIVLPQQGIIPKSRYLQ